MILLSADESWNAVGDIAFLHLPAQPTVLIGSAEVAFELLEKRSEIYSDRRMPVMLEMCVHGSGLSLLMQYNHIYVRLYRMSWDYNFAFMSYGPKWRMHRRSFHQYFKPDIIHRYQDIQLSEARAFLHRLLVTPDYHREHIRQ